MMVMMLRVVPLDGGDWDDEDVAKDGDETGGDGDGDLTLRQSRALLLK